MRWTAAMRAAALAALLAAAGCAPSPQGQAFAAAKAAVRATPGAPADAQVESLALRDLVGLKGSRAQVVCGSASGGGGSDIPFIYVWTLTAAVPDTGVRSGQVILMRGGIDRRAANRLHHFCGMDVGGSAANPYDYFQ